MDAKDFFVIMQIFIILSDYVLEFRQDNCMLFVFQYSFASQSWKLAENMQKFLYFILCNLRKVLKKTHNFILEIFYQQCF